MWAVGFGALEGPWMIELLAFVGSYGKYGKEQG